jgi:hypothetical protein
MIEQAEIQRASAKRKKQLTWDGARGGGQKDASESQEDGTADHSEAN